MTEKDTKTTLPTEETGNLNLALVQTDICWEDVDCNLDKLEKLISGIAERTDLIILPEMFSTGFTMNVNRFESPAGRTSFEWMKALAVKMNISLAGSILYEEAGKYFNRFFLVYPDGNHEKYDKRHVFRMAGEHKVISPGK